MSLLSVASKVIGAAAQLVGEIKIRGSVEIDLVNADAKTLGEMNTKVAAIEKRLQGVEGDVQSEAELLRDLAGANATLARWVLGLAVTCLILGGIAIAALVLAV